MDVGSEYIFVYTAVLFCIGCVSASSITATDFREIPSTIPDRLTHMDLVAGDFDRFAVLRKSRRADYSRSRFLLREDRPDR